MNYENLVNMYYARKNHKLAEWHTYCDWILTGPPLRKGTDPRKGNAQLRHCRLSGLTVMQGWFPAPARSPKCTAGFTPELSTFGNLCPDGQFSGNFSPAYGFPFAFVRQ